MSERIRLGVDLGGTKIEIAALGEDGTMLARERVATPRGSYPGTIDAIVALVREFETRFDCAGAPLGIGTPGSLSPATGLIRNANSTVLNEKPLLSDLRGRFGPRVRIGNDANCFALSEAIDGAGADADVVFGVILGTGVGAGVVIGRRLLSGHNGIAGEWGHNPLPWPRDDERPGPACYCGKLGCIETFLCGPAFEREHAARSGVRATAAEIAARAASGDADANESLARYIDRLSRGLAHVIDILDPDCIVLGGGVSNIAALFERLPDALRPQVFSDVVTTPVVRAAHGDSSGVRGAAWLHELDAEDDAGPGTR